MTDRHADSILLAICGAVILCCLCLWASAEHPTTVVALTPAPVKAIPAQTAPPAISPEAPLFVLNLHTGKFHRPDCASVDRIAEWNRDETSESREELIAKGFEPCGGCKP